MKRSFGKFISQSQIQERARHKVNRVSTDNFSMAQKKISVRGLPDNNISSSSRYWRARGLIENESGHGQPSWIEEQEQFAKLHKIPYNGKGEVATELADNIEKYLHKVRARFKKEEDISDMKLAQKLAVYKKQWMRLYDGVDPDSLVLNGTETFEVRELKKAYDKAIKALKREHSPIIHPSPRSSNFDYFCNGIRLLASKKTICFCLDAEAFEFDNDMVTEIGISIYDPRENFFSFVPITRNYHIIISEALTVRNSKFVIDSKDCYQLGESLVLSLGECVEFVQALLDFYLEPRTVEDESWSRALVGHNVQGDISWLKQMGIKIPKVAKNHSDNLDYQLSHVNAPNEPIFVLDTEKLYRFTYGNKGGSLGKLLRLLKIPHSFLHNAGNDAYYTLQLLLRMCDINYRKQNGLDDLIEMNRRIEQWLQREREEPKVVPMSYLETVKTFHDSSRIKKDSNPSGKKKGKTLVHQTEFGGSQWYPTAREAFLSTLR